MVVTTKSGTKYDLTTSREELSRPTALLAIAAGVEDDSYSTVRYGMVASYRGEAMVTLPNGSEWRCVGHGPQGNAETLARDGYIEMIPSVKS